MDARKALRIGVPVPFARRRAKEERPASDIISEFSDKSNRSGAAARSARKRAFTGKGDRLYRRGPPVDFILKGGDSVDSIHMIGYDAVHPSDFVYDVPENHGYCLLILTHTQLRFRDADGTRIYPPRHAALFMPDAPIHYGACEDTYSNDWIVFASDESYVTQFPVLNRPFPVLDPDYCHNLFQLLTWEHMQGGHETVISQLMALLFQKLRAGIDQPFDSDYRLELSALRRRIMSQPTRRWNVSDMAAQLHISAGYLHLLYKRQFGTTCMDDVIEGRVRMAKDYLTHTRLRVQEIASLCGYASPEHFSRQFRRICGMSPGQYRKTNGGGQ